MGRTSGEVHYGIGRGLLAKSTTGLGEGLLVKSATAMEESHWLGSRERSTLQILHHRFDGSKLHVSNTASIVPWT